MTSDPSNIVAFQGEHGAYSEEAAFSHFGAGIQTLPRDSFDLVFEAVVLGEASHGLIPIENSLAGSVHRNYDLLLRYDLNIVGETHLRIRHCLMALPGTELEEIHRVASHPQALAQCEKFLHALSGVEIEPAYDTAGTAKAINEQQLAGKAAIAAERAAQVYDLQVLAENIEDDPSNYTRFLAMTPEPTRPGEEAKTSIAFSLNNKPGILHEALGFFARRQIDLTKIESRPLVGNPWEYLFYLDLAGSAEDQAVRSAIEELEEAASFFRLLGSYPRERWRPEVAGSIEQGESALEFNSSP